MVEASHYYQSEDEPDMSNPHVALDMYNSQKASLPTLEQVLETVQQIEAQLGEIYTVANASNLPDVAKKAEKVWRRTQHLHQHIQQQDAVNRGGEAVVEAVTTQRDEIIAELNQLVEAIEEGNEAHPKLKQYAADIRQDEAEYQQEYVADAVQESAYDQAFENLTEDIQQALMNTGIRRWVASHYAACLMDIFTNPHKDFNEAQAASLQQLFATFPPMPAWKANMDATDGAPMHDVSELADDGGVEEFDVDD